MYELQVMKGADYFARAESEYAASGLFNADRGSFSEIVLEVLDAATMKSAWSRKFLEEAPGYYFEPSGDSGVWFYYVTLAAEQEGLLFIRNNQQSFQVAHGFIGAPVFGQLDGAASQVSVILLQLGFEAAKQSEGVSGGAGESGHDFVLIQTSDLARVMLDNSFTKRNLAVARQYDTAVAADT